MTVLANVTYSLCQKMTPTAVHPLVALSVTYTISLLCTLLLIPFTLKGVGYGQALREVNSASYILGGAIVLLEAGFLLAFRAGWSLGYAALFSNTAVAILLIPAALFYFREQMVPSNYAGVVLAMAGLYLMTRR